MRAKIVVADIVCVSVLRNNNFPRAKVRNYHELVAQKSGKKNRFVCMLFPPGSNILFNKCCIRKASSKLTREQFSTTTFVDCSFPFPD